MPLWFVWIIGSMYPCINPIRLSVAPQAAYFHNSIPYGLTLEAFGYRHAFQVTGFTAVQMGGLLRAILECVSY